MSQKELAHLFSLYSSRMLNNVRNAYVGDLPKREAIARRNYQKEMTDQGEAKTENLNRSMKEEFRRSRNYENKITLNKNRNETVRCTIEGMEKDFVPTLVHLFPGKKGEVMKYIRLAGYKDNEIDALIDRTVGRDSRTEFLYKGRSKKDARYSL